MKDTPEYKALEEALKDEKAGSLKIQALAYYTMLKDAEYRLAQLRNDVCDLNRRELETCRIFVEQAVESWKYTAEALEYEEAFANAPKTLHLYFTKYDGHPGHVLLEDLAEINRGKGKKKS
jgi:hypothetical protein